MRGVNSKGIGMLSLMISLTVLIAFIAVIGYLALVYYQNEVGTVHGGTISVIDTQLVGTGTNTILATTIQNMGPSNVVFVNFTISSENMTADLSGNPLSPRIQRGFVFHLTDHYELLSTYRLVVTATFTNGETFSVNIDLVCKKSS